MPHHPRSIVKTETWHAECPGQNKEQLIKFNRRGLDNRSFYFAVCCKGSGNLAFGFLWGLFCNRIHILS